jgi:rare lipoprotein A
MILALAFALGGCRRTGGGPAYYGGGEETNVVEGSTVTGEIVPADSDVGTDVDEFAGGGEFSTTATGTVEPTETTTVPAETTTAETTTTTTTTAAGVLSGGTAEGYRVQIVASSYEDNARAVADKIRAAYPGTGVYVQHIQNLYKVRVGDFTSRAGAESMRDKLKAAGYTDAWIVKEQVNTQ